MMNNQLRLFTFSSITSFFLLITLLITSSFVLYATYYYNNYNTEKRQKLHNISLLLQHRINNYRSLGKVIFDTSLNTHPLPYLPQIIQLDNGYHPDVFTLERSTGSTIIIGNSEPKVINTIVQIANFLDTYWSEADHDPKMFYINDKDNTLFLITRASLKARVFDRTESNLHAILDERVTKLYKQLRYSKEVELFSPLQKTRLGEQLYISMGHKFIVADNNPILILFDIPINDLLLDELVIQNVSLTISENYQHSNSSQMLNTKLYWPWISIHEPILQTPLVLSYRYSLVSVATSFFQACFGVLLLTVFLLPLVTLSYFYLRKNYRLINTELHMEMNRIKNENRQIVELLPVGIFLYEKKKDRLYPMNARAKQLSKKITSHLFLDQDGEVTKKCKTHIHGQTYAITSFNRSQYPGNHLLVVNNLTNKIRLTQKTRLLRIKIRRNQRIMTSILKNLGQELEHPIKNIQIIINRLLSHPFAKKEHNDIQKLFVESENVNKLIESIILSGQLKAGVWRSQSDSFTLLPLIDSTLREILPVLNSKGLSLYHHYKVNPHFTTIGDANALKKTLLLLLSYAIADTKMGKLILITEYSVHKMETIDITLMHTGNGFTDNTMISLDAAPFIKQATYYRNLHTSGLTFYLCQQLCQQMGGSLTITSRYHIGSRYKISLPLTEQVAQNQEHPDNHRPLKDIRIALDITTEEAKDIITTTLTSNGANCLLPGDDDSAHILLTDNETRVAKCTLICSPSSLALEEFSYTSSKVNFNITSLLVETILRMVAPAKNVVFLSDLSAEIDDVTLNLYHQKLLAGGYLQIFTQTVPEDINNLYTSALKRDKLMLSRVIHRLKGVFAMLELWSGKTLCEKLEQYIAAGNTQQIELNIKRIDHFVNGLLQQGSHNE